jgi:hypothetical protein
MHKLLTEDLIHISLDEITATDVSSSSSSSD